MSDDKTSSASGGSRRKDVISEWRAGHLEELDRNLSTWKSIRDDSDASDKDRIEAAKSIARQMGALSPDSKGTAAASARSDAPKLKPEHAAELESILAGMTGPQ